MKLITEDAFYIQKVNMEYFSELCGPKPIHVYVQLFGDNYFTPYGTVELNHRERFDFIKVNNQDAIDYFNSVDWIIDYDEIKDLTNEEIRIKIKCIEKEMDDNLKEFNAMNSLEQSKNLRLFFNYKSLRQKNNYLNDFLEFRKGNIQMNFPEGIENKESIKVKKLINKSNNL